MTRAGRPHDNASTAAILRATLDVLAEKGYAGTSLDEVVERAGSSKPTLYRRWPSKPHLVADAVRHGLAAANPRVPTSADPAEAVRTVLRNVVRALTTTPLGGAMRALIGVAESEPELSECLRAVETERRRLLHTAVGRASTGRSRQQIDLAVDWLLGAIYYRFLIRRVPITTRLADELTDDLTGRFVAHREIRE
jgi:AcrR family transcriptional regulator